MKPISKETGNNGESMHAEACDSAVQSSNSSSDAICFVDEVFY
jgi:hypothetical protein